MSPQSDNALFLKNVFASSIDGANVEQEIRFLYDELLELEIKPCDWDKLFNAMLQHLPGFQDKWDVIRFIYSFLNLRYDYIIAERAAWKITKRFKLLFTKYDHTDTPFYGPTLTGIRLFQALGESKNEPLQLNLIDLLSRLRGVRA